MTARHAGESVSGHTRSTEAKPLDKTSKGYERMSRVELMMELKRLHEAGRRAGHAQGQESALPAPPEDAEQELIRVQTEQLIESQRLLEASRDRYFELYDSAPIAYVTLDERGTIQDMNSTAVRLLDAGASIRRRSFRSIVVPTDRPKLGQHLRRCASAAREFAKRRHSGGAGPTPDDWAAVQVTTDLSIRSGSGKLIPVQLVSSPGIADEPGPRGWCFRTAVMDLSVRREAEEAVRASEERLRLALEAAQAGTWELDAQTDRAVWARIRTGRDEPDTEHAECQSAWLSLIHPEDRQAAMAELREVVAGRKPELRFEFRTAGTDGDDRWILSLGRPWHDSSGAVIALRGIHLDITDRRRSQEELTRHRDNLEELVRERTQQLEESHNKLRLSERMAALGTLSAGLGHDMGNLLLPMRVRLESLERQADLLGGESRAGPLRTVHEDLHTLRRCVDYLQRLANGLRMFALDPESPDGPDHRTDLAEWWADAEPFLKNAVPKGVGLEVRVAPGTPPVAISRQAVTQAVFNLVQNAGDVMRDRGSGRIVVWTHVQSSPLHARTDRGGDRPMVELGISDDGPGMTPEVQRRCLEPFFTTKTRQLSTGLGLALVHGIVQRAKGSIRIDSEPGRGTTFTLVLPAHTRGAGHNSVRKRTDRPRAAVRLRDPRIRGLVISMLHSMEFDVDSGAAESNAAAVREVLLTDDASQAADAAACAPESGCAPPLVVLFGAGHAPRRAGRMLEVGPSPRPGLVRQALEEVRREFCSVEQERRTAGVGAGA